MKSWREVTKYNPCHICGKSSWCSFSADGNWAVCRRLDTGEGTHKIDQSGVDYWVYRLKGSHASSTLIIDLPSETSAERADPETLDAVYRALLATLPLDSHHRENLRNRGLIDEEITRRGYRTLPAKDRAKYARQLKNRFGTTICTKIPGLYIKEKDGERWWSLAGSSGILIPSRDPEGRIIALKIRADEVKDSNKGRYSYFSSASHGGPSSGSPVHIPLFEGETETARLTEGELKADIATVLSGIFTVSVPGASHWRKALPTLKQIETRTVWLSFDADARQNPHVAASLQRALQGITSEGFKAAVEVWPKEYGKGIDNVLAAGYKPELRTDREATATVIEIATTAGVKPVSLEPAKSAEEEKHKKQAVAQILIEIGKTVELFHDQMQVPYAAVKEGSVQRVLRLRGKQFKNWLAGRFYDDTGKAVNSEAMASALLILEVQASRGQCIFLHNRFARTSDAIWLDLCDDKWRAVKVTKEGWEVLETPPILFRRFNHQAPLPIPEKNGDLRKILWFLNLVREEDKLLILVWLVVAPIVNIPRPILGCHGSQGSAKTTAARMLRMSLDPSAVESIEIGRDPMELAQVLDHHAIPFFDNVTHIQPWQADMLCRAVTGGGFTKRELYTDTDDVLMSFKRAILVTGINVPTVAPDLLDRFLLVLLERIPPKNRREEVELWQEFEAVRPCILGGLLSTLSEAMRIYPTLERRALPRMADFARWGMAAAEALGYGADVFLTAMFGNVEHQVEEVLESDPVAQSVRKFLEKQSNTRWEGTAALLLAELTKLHGQGEKGDGWPKQPHHLTRRLRILQATLEDVGIEINFLPKSKEGRKVALQFQPARLGREKSVTSVTSGIHIEKSASYEVTLKDSERHLRENERHLRDQNSVQPELGDAHIELGDAHIQSASPSKPALNQGNGAGDAHDALFPTQSGEHISPYPPGDPSELPLASVDQSQEWKEAYEEYIASLDVKDEEEEEGEEQEDDV